MHSKSTVSFEGSHLNYSRVPAVARGEEGKKRQRREEYLDRLMQEKVGERTGVLMQMGRAEVERTKSTEIVTEKVYGPGDTGHKQRWEHAAVYGRNPDATMRNQDSFDTTQKREGSSFSRPHLPKIHKGRQVGQHFQLDGADGVHGDLDDSYGMRGAHNPTARVDARLSSFVASPPPLIAGGIGTYDAASRNQPSTQKGALQRVIGQKRSPDSFFKQTARDNISTLKTKLLLDQPPYPRTYKQLPAKKGQLGEGGIGLIDSSSPAAASSSKPASPSHRSFARTDREIGVPIDLFGIQVDAKQAAQLGYGTENAIEERLDSGREPDSALKMERKQTQVRFVREKARLMEEVRQNRERAIEHAQLKKEAQLRRKRRGEAGALNFSMRFEGSKDMAKFERHVEDVFAKKKARRHNRNAISIDFGGISADLKLDLQKRGFNDSQQKQSDLDGLGPRERGNRGSQLNIFNQSSLLPRIDAAEAQGSLRGASIAENGRRRQLAISSIDGSTMISRRERKFKHSNVKDKLKAFDFLAQSKENAGTFLLRSHHYKYNRIKEGGWGVANSSSASSHGDRSRHMKATTLAAEVLAAGSEGSRGSKLGAKDLPLLLNSSSHLDDLWSNDQLPKLNAAQAAEVNRLIKLENQRSSIAQSSHNHHDAKGSQQHPGAGSTIPASSVQKSPRNVVESKFGIEAAATQTQSSPPRKLRMQDGPYQAALEGVRRPIVAVPSGREQSKTTLMTDYSLPKGKRPQLNLQDRQIHQSPLARKDGRPRRQHGSPDLISAQTKVPDQGSEQADPTGLGLHTDFSLDAAARRRHLDVTRLHLSYDQGALQALHASSVNIQDPYRSQVFAMRAAITATETPRVGQTTETKTGPSQLSTAAYPFITHHSIRKAAAKTNLSHEQSKMTTSVQDSAGNFRSRPKPGMSVIERSQAHFRRVRQQLREQFDRQTFNMSYQVTDRSMSLLRGTRGLMPASSATADSIEQHATARRTREKLESQIAQLQQQVRDRQKQIKQLKLDKTTQSQKFEDQIEINSRLDGLVVDRETHEMPGQQVSATPPLPAGGYPADFTLKDARLDMLAHELHGGSIGHSGSSQPIMNSFAHPTAQTSTLGIPPPSQSPGLHQLPNAIGSATALASSALHSHVPADPSIHDFYQYLFSADLKSSRDRAHLELHAHDQWLQSYAQELTALLQENDVVRSMIRRYQRMIRELKDGNEGFEPREQSERLLPAAELRRQAEMSDVLKAVESLDLKAIAGELYKYGENGQADQQTQSKSETGMAQLTVHTPLTAAHQRTQMSFMGKSRANAGNIVDKRKVDGSIILMNRVYKETKALDSIVAHLAQLKTIFKAEKLSLFVIAPELQLNLFRNPKERRQNYRKIFVNGGTTSMSEQAVYALYASEEDYCTPVFRDLDEAACHMFGNRVILIPMKALGRVRMSLQIVGSAETRDGKARGRTGVRRKTTSGFEGPSFGHVTDRDAVSRGGASAQLRRGRGSSMSDAKPRSLSGAAHSQKSAGSRMRRTKRTPAAVGWTRNDFCFLKILTNYLAMNVDYYEQRVLQRAKEKKIDEIIDFAQDIMSVKTYRQLVKKVRDYRQTVLGFEECALFFEDTETGDLFTLTDLEAGSEAPVATTKASSARTSTAFAKELLFPEDAIVVFPSTIGMTGEVHQRVGIRFRNGVGGASTQQQEVLDDAQSQKTAPSFTSTKRNPLPGHLSRTQATQLERIKEGNPQAENEAEVNSEQMRQTGYSGRGFNPFRAGVEPATADRRASVERRGAGATGGFEEKTPTTRDFQRTTGARHESPLARAGWETKRQLDQSPLRRPTTLELLDGGNQRTAYGTTQRASPLLDGRALADQIGASAASQPGRDGESGSNAGRAIPRKHALHGKKSPAAGQRKAGGQAAPRYFADFLPDIDNFLGVKDLDNFVISSIRDDGYALGDKSVGVLHLFNKLDKSRVNRDDLARIEQFSRLVGALAQKAHSITSSLTLVIGLSQNIQAPSASLGQLTTAAGMGDFEQASAPMDALRKQIGSEEATRKEQESQILAELTKGTRTTGAGRGRRY